MDKKVSESMQGGDTIATDAFGREESLKKGGSFAEEIKPLDSPCRKAKIERAGLPTSKHL